VNILRVTLGFRMALLQDTKLMKYSEEKSFIREYPRIFFFNKNDNSKFLGFQNNPLFTLFQNDVTNFGKFKIPIRSLTIFYFILRLLSLYLSNCENVTAISKNDTWKETIAEAEVIGLALLWRLKTVDKQQFLFFSFQKFSF